MTAATDSICRRRRLALFISVVSVTPFVGGCWDEDPCDPQQIVKDTFCYAAPVPPAPPREGGSGIDDTFGKTCTTQDDCAGGNAPVCGAPRLPMCTQINCQGGEENAGACPAGWTCLTVPPNPSVCLKQ